MEIITRNLHLCPLCQHRKSMGWLFRVVCVCVLALLCHSLWLGAVSDTITGCSLPHSRRDWGSGLECDVTRRPPHTKTNCLSAIAVVGIQASQWSHFSYMPNLFFLWLFCLTCVPEIWPGLSPLMGKFEGPRLTHYHWHTKEPERWSPHVRCGCWTRRPSGLSPGFWRREAGCSEVINSFICLVLVWPWNSFLQKALKYDFLNVLPNSLIMAETSK